MKSETRMFFCKRIWKIVTMPFNANLLRHDLIYQANIIRIDKRWFNNTRSTKPRKQNGRRHWSHYSTAPKRKLNKNKYYLWKHDVSKWMNQSSHENEKHYSMHFNWNKHNKCQLHHWHPLAQALVPVQQLAHQEQHPYPHQVVLVLQVERLDWIQR